jgi:hypothetical protein
MSFTPTDEQDQIVTAIEAGDNIAVQALAGTGKTETLRLGAEAKERRLKMGFYIAFGKNNRADAKDRFPGTVECHTSHSMAWEVGRYYRRRWSGRDAGRTGTQLADAFGTKPFAPAPDRTITSVGVAVLAKLAVQRFARSADRELTAWHVAPVEGIDGDAMAALKTHVLPYAKAMWNDLQDPHSDRAECSHDHYRKIWALKKPRLKANFIMLDEAQDIDALTLDVLLRQDCQLIAVGDSNQALYQWRNSIDALTKWPAQQRLHLTESFRFGPQIADRANRWLAALDCELPLRGRGEPGTVGPLADPDVVLCRTNAGAVEAAHEALEAGRRVGMAKRVSDNIKDMCKAALQLQAGLHCDYRELATFASWREVLHYIETDPSAGELAVFVRLVEKWGAAQLLKIANQFKDTDKGPVDLAVMTGHSAKGLQYPRVKIGADFREPSLDGEGQLRPMDPAELQLCYVAVTRAQQHLDDEAIAWIDDYLTGEATDDQPRRWYPRELKKAGTHG